MSTVVNEKLMKEDVGKKVNATLHKFSRKLTIFDGDKT